MSSAFFSLPGFAKGLAGSFYSGSAETLAGAKTIDDDDAMILKLDPAGAARDVNLPAEGEIDPAGRMYWIVNAADAAENLVVKNDGGDTIVTISQNESAMVYNAGKSGGTESSWVLICLPQIALS
jgi:hypothetical protein